MADRITITGTVGTAPEVKHVRDGLTITTFRLASNRRRKTDDGWEDAESNWYSVSAYRYLAANAASSLKKGDAVIVTGSLRVRNWTAGEKNGTSIEIDADAIGHDLTWGRAEFQRVKARRAADDGSASGPGEDEDAPWGVPGADGAESAVPEVDSLVGAEGAPVPF